MWIWMLFAGIVGVVLGIIICKRLTSKPLTIEFPVIPMDWVKPISTAFMLVLVAFVVEYVLSFHLCKTINSDTPYGRLLLKLFENGLFIPVFCSVISYLFEKAVEAQNLDYLQLYNEKVSKVCFSVLVVSFCIVMWLTGKGIQEDTSDSFYLNRILMWLLSVIGTWIGLGFGCKGRVGKENEIIKDSNKGITTHDKIKFAAPIAICLLLCDAIMLLSFLRVADKVFSILLFGALMFVITEAAWLVFVKKTVLYRVRSLRSFERAQKMCLKKGIGKGQYGRMHYRFNKSKMAIDEIPLIYPGHEKDKEFIDLFGAKTIPFNNPNEAYEILEELYRKQDAYIKKGYEDCIEEEHRKKREEIK